VSGEAVFFLSTPTLWLLSSGRCLVGPTRPQIKHRLVSSHNYRSYPCVSENLLSFVGPVSLKCPSDCLALS